MVRPVAMALFLIILLLGLMAGYLGASRSRVELTFERQIALEQTAGDFYSALGMADRLSALLAPEFIEQRLDLMQTQGRGEFLQSADEEARTYPYRAFVPMSMNSDGSWVAVVVRVSDGEAGNFGSISLPKAEFVRQEMLEISDGQVVKRVILNGSAMSLRSLEPNILRVATPGSNTLKIEQHEFTAYGVERVQVAYDRLIVVDLGRLIVTLAESEFDLEAGDAMHIPAAQSVAITNKSGAGARILMIYAASLELPSETPDANALSEPGTGVLVSVIGQSRSLSLVQSCLLVSGGQAALAPGEKLPLHPAVGHEFVVPRDGELDVRNRSGTFLRTDSSRQWQDELAFARIASGTTVAARPGALTSYAASGTVVARFWIFTIEVSECR